MQTPGSLHHGGATIMDDSRGTSPKKKTMSKTKSKKKGLKKD